MLIAKCFDRGTAHAPNEANKLIRQKNNEEKENIFFKKNVQFMQHQKNDLFFNRCELRKRRRRIEEYRAAFQIILMDSVETEIEKNGNPFKKFKMNAVAMC